MSTLLDYLTPRVKEDADCWIWQRGLTSNGTPTMHPTGHKQTSVRRWLAQQMGKAIPANYVATNTCGNPRCVAPDHLLIASRSKLGKLTDARTGFTRTPQRRKKISDSKRATAKLNPEAVRAIRAAKSSVKVAQEYGIAKATAIRIRAYESWRDYSNPFAGLMT
jgi:hypothetical protein